MNHCAIVLNTAGRRKRNSLRKTWMGRENQKARLGVGVSVCVEEFKLGWFTVVLVRSPPRDAFAGQAVYSTELGCMMNGEASIGRGEGSFDVMLCTNIIVFVLFVTREGGEGRIKRTIRPIL